MRFVCNTVIPIDSKTINHILNANKKFIFTENEANFEKSFDELVERFITPIFKKFAMQEFFFTKM